jgi:hypothetical protein
MPVCSGDSYSDVGYNYLDSSLPSDDEPLGIEFPGSTYTEPDEPNWVGHLITNYPPTNQLLVYDYAQGGARVAQVKNQIQVMFKLQISQKPAWAPWTAENALFSELRLPLHFCVYFIGFLEVTWVGINDAAYDLSLFFCLDWFLIYSAGGAAKMKGL